MPKSTPPTWQIELGRQIRQRRKYLKYEQQELAKALGVDPETIRSYEAGTRPPPLPKLRVIVRELDATFSVEGITISVSTLPPLQLAKVAQQIPFDFQCSYTGMDVHIAASTEGFEVRGYAPAKASDTEGNSSEATSSA
jgi:transcriptional regulator with XRE-family HTH domain